MTATTLVYKRRQEAVKKGGGREVQIFRGHHEVIGLLQS